MLARKIIKNKKREIILPSRQGCQEVNYKEEGIQEVKYLMRQRQNEESFNEWKRVNNFFFLSTCTQSAPCQQEANFHLNIRIGLLQANYNNKKF